MFRFFTVFTLIAYASVGLPCTTVVLPSASNTIVGKNLDWAEGQGLAYVNKRHVHKKAIFVNAPQKPLEWTSKYMSLTFTQTGREFPWEGMNEAGLSVNIMMLYGSQPPPADQRPAVNSLQWIQYILDTSGSVPEAIANARATRITGPMSVTLHYMACDRAGRCAVFEDLAGQMVIHAGPSLPYTALANDTYDNSVSYLHQQLATRAPNEILTSQSPNSLDRFTRAALLASMYKPPLDPVTYAFNSLQNVHQNNFTQWSFVFKLSSNLVYFRTLQFPQIRGINLSQFDPRCSMPVKIFNMNSPLAGDITSRFTNYSDSANRWLVEQGREPQNFKSAVEAYPATTRCME